MGWNGEDLRDEYARALGDPEPGNNTFRGYVLGFMNDILNDFSSRFEWPHLKERGTKLLTAGEEEHDMFLSTPTAPVIASQSGGSLTDGSSYTVKVTYYRSSDQLESMAGAVSNTVTTNSPNLQLAVTSIPTSSETSVTARRIYLSKDSGAYYLVATISNNTSTSTTITANATSVVQPQPHNGIREFLGRPWLPANGKWLDYKAEDDLRMLYPNTMRTGLPDFFAPTKYGTMLFDALASGTEVVYFNYIRQPKQFVPDTTTEPDMPLFLKPILNYGVLWKGYEYRERELATQYKTLYEQEIERKISETARTKQGYGRIRDVMGDTDGRAY